MEAPEGPAGVAGERKPLEPDPQAEPGLTPPAKKARGPSPPESRGEVGEYLERLQGDAEDADKAFRELWEVPKDLIPALILHVEDDAPTSLRELPVLVLDKQRFVRVDENKQELVYTIPGMGRFEYDRVAAGETRSRRAVKAVFKRLEGFPVGVVLRAALVNRFQSMDFPAGDDRVDCVGWWQRFYEVVAAKL